MGKHWYCIRDTDCAMDSVSKEPIVMPVLYYLLPKLKQIYSTEKKHILYNTIYYAVKYKRKGICGGKVCTQRSISDSRATVCIECCELIYRALIYNKNRHYFRYYFFAMIRLL